MDYHPFGLTIAGRAFNKTDYRFGFNGKENDTDFGKDQLIQDYGFRLYNPSIARFLSVDPLTASYPHLTPYQFASNSPIYAIDLDGLEAIPSTENTQKTRAVIENYGAKQVKKLGENYTLQAIERSNSGINGIWRVAKNLHKSGEYSNVLGAVGEGQAAAEMTSYFKDGGSFIPFANPSGQHDVETTINPYARDQYDVLVSVTSNSTLFTHEKMYDDIDPSSREFENSNVRGFLFGFVPEGRTYNLFVEVKLRNPNKSISNTLSGFNKGISQLEISYEMHGESSPTTSGGIGSTNRYLLFMDGKGFEKLMSQYPEQVKKGLERLKAIGGGLILQGDLYQNTAEELGKILGEVNKATTKETSP